MNIRQQELLARLENALNYIAKSPKTANEVTLIFEDLVISLEEIADNLKTTSDEQEAETLRALIQRVESSG